MVGDARVRGVPALVVVGQATPEATDRAVQGGAEVVSLTERFGAGRAHREVLDCIGDATDGWLGAPGGVLVR